MNAELKEAFSRIKPVCDVVMVCPSPESIAAFEGRISDMKNETVHELQQYILFPFITHIKSTEIEKKYEMQWRMADTMRIVLEKVTVNSFEMCMKIETGLLSLVFDNSKAGMIADVPEELKLSVMKCLTVLMLNLDKQIRESFLKTQMPLLAQAIFVSVHLAKLEKLRALRIAAIHCLTAHTATHARLTTKYQIVEEGIEQAAVDMLCNILPGVLAALQDVATCTYNPAHAVIVAAIDAIHRIICITMNNKYVVRKEGVTAEDFAAVLQKATAKDREVSKDKDPKDIPKRSPEWYAMAGEKLSVVTKSLVCLTTHEHYRVRRELAVFCARILSECYNTMQPSIPIALDVLISLVKDDYPEVAQYSTNAVNAYFANTSGDAKLTTMDSLSDNFFAVLNSLPRILNNIDSSRKLSALNLLHGYIQILCDHSRPQRLTAALSAHNNMQSFCHALTEAATIDNLTSLAQHATRDVLSPPPTDSPWCKLRHLDGACEMRLRDICALLAGAECAELILDRLLELFHQQREPEIVYVLNYMGSASNSSESLVKRILDTFLEEDVWYLPLDVASTEQPVGKDETLDVNVYNPRAWTTDRVPDLYEGTVEQRYTGVSYATPHVPSARSTCARAQRHVLTCCVLTAATGGLARRLADRFRPYLMRSLCLVLERVGSKYEMVHLAGLKAINDIAAACGHDSVADLIKCNADYFTNQVTMRLKKAWNCQSALEILSVVMEYSDASILNCLYGIVQDVLIQSCDKYHERHLHAYLQVFLTFIECIHKWFPHEEAKQSHADDIDPIKELLEFINNKEESERSNEEIEESGKTVEEMYREDLMKKEEDVLDYDDTVTEETPPLPQHIKVTVTILKRCLNFVSSTQRDEALLALQVLTAGLPILRPYEDELLPLVHLTWAPLVSKLESKDPVVIRRGLDLLVVMAELAKDFIAKRAEKDVLPHIYEYLRKSAAESRLKDAGSWYRGTGGYLLQAAALRALPTLATSLQLHSHSLSSAMLPAQLYLSNKQPKPLQELAVKFFKTVLTYDCGAAWLHLRELCNNDEVLEPPTMVFMKLEPIVGTPYVSVNKDYQNNINLIFDREESNKSESLYLVF